MQLSGSPFDFLIAFFGGILASFTPCVYPLLPISVGYIVDQAQNSRSKALSLSLAYVTGIALIYSLLGIIATLGGSFLGKFSTHPLVNFSVGVMICIFGFWMLDLLQFNFRLQLKIPELKRGSHLLALGLGLVSGLMITPCLTPILGAILAYLSTKKNIYYGGFLLLCFSYGLGFIFILSGIFGVGILSLLKPGKWMLVVKRICGILIILGGAYFIFTAIRRFL